MARTIYLTWTSKWDGIWFKNHPAIWMLSLGRVQLASYKGDIIKDLDGYQTICCLKVCLDFIVQNGRQIKR